MRIRHSILLLLIILLYGCKRFDIESANSYLTKNFNGSILIAKGNKVLLEKGFGKADFDKQILHPQHSD